MTSLVNTEIVKMKPQRAVLLDRDGTIVVERHYLSDPEKLELLPGATDGLLRLSRLGLGLVVISNQSGVGKGLFDAKNVTLVHEKLCELLKEEGIKLDGFYFCPHTVEDNCLCRKPRAGLIERAAKELKFDPQESFFIGDKACDVELGKQIGATTFLVLTGYGSQVAAAGMVTPDYIVDGVYEAAQVIEHLVTRDEKGAADAVRS